MMMNSYFKTSLPYSVMDQMEHNIIAEEMMERKSVCKPDCESWSYEVAKASHYTKKGKSTQNLCKDSLFL